MLDMEEICCTCEAVLSVTHLRQCVDKRKGGRVRSTIASDQNAICMAKENKKVESCADLIDLKF